MNTEQFFIGIAITAISGFAIKKILEKKPAQQPAPIIKPQQTQTPLQPTSPQRAKNYSELMNEIKAEKKEIFNKQMEIQGEEIEESKPRQAVETAGLTYMEADNLWAIDERGRPTKRKVWEDEKDIPMALSRYDRIVAIGQLISALIILFMFLKGMG